MLKTLTKLIIQKSAPLSGSVDISGAKNAALPILAATLLTDGESTLKSVPNLMDVDNMLEILKHIGCDHRRTTSGSLKITTGDKLLHDAPYELTSLLRASFLIMGPMLAKTGKTKISFPGGCPIGSRPVDLHLKGFAAMGAKITQGHGCVEAVSKKLVGAKIYLDFPSVGATENLMMAASLAEGRTIIENAATEPEIVDLANFINRMGGEIKGAGTDTIRINGVQTLKSVNHTVIPDRIEAGTFMVAAAITKGEITINNVVPEHLKPINAKLREIGIDITELDNSIIVNASNRMKSADIKTLPFPGFPTDMQAQFSSLMSVVDGTSIIIETIFENRFMHVGELKRMGAHIKIEGRSEVIEGTKKLMGAQVKATDLRAGAGLVIAGLAAEGETVISDAHHIDRGYEKFEEKLYGLGANIKRENDNDTN